MSRRTAGIALMAIAGWLYTTRFLAAAIWGSGFSTWNAEHFANLLGYVDRGLTVWSLTAFSAGLVYLLWSEIRAIRGR